MTISSEGTYIISGELSSGQIVVDASDDAKVQLVLAGATIHNENGPAIYAKSADKCFVTLADGSFRLVAGGNDIKSNKDTEATQGFVSFTGGTVLVNGPSSDGDGAFDYDSEATISGGTVLMIGSSRMAIPISGPSRAVARLLQPRAPRLHRA